jgi:hypothetical protein
MGALLDCLRGIVRDELARCRQPELATVTRVFSRAGDAGKDNHQVSLRLRGSGVELARVPVAVARLGLSALPREGDLMLVNFVGGDLNAPVAVGCLYDEQAHPPVAQDHEVVYQVPDDGASGVRRFHCALPSGATVTLDDDTLQIVLGDTSVVVHRDGDVAIQAKGKVQLEAGGDLELSAQGDLKLSAQGDLTLSGASTSVSGQSEAKLQAPQLAIAGMTQFSPS